MRRLHWMMLCALFILIFLSQAVDVRLWKQRRGPSQGKPYIEWSARAIWTRTAIHLCLSDTRTSDRELRSEISPSVKLWAEGRTPVVQFLAGKEDPQLLPPALAIHLYLDDFRDDPAGDL